MDRDDAAARQRVAEQERRFLFEQVSDWLNARSRPTTRQAMIIFKIAAEAERERAAGRFLVDAP